MSKAYAHKILPLSYGILGGILHDLLLRSVFSRMTILMAFLLFSNAIHSSAFAPHEPASSKSPRTATTQWHLMQMTRNTDELKTPDVSVIGMPEYFRPPFENAIHLNADPNDHRYAAADWLHNICSIRRSTILRDIREPMLTIFFWSALVSIVYQILKIHAPAKARYMCISSTPHSFLVSALGLLLVFRTNSAYQRFAEGRAIWERILSISRNLSRLTALYEVDIGTSRKLQMLRLLGAFPYLLHDHIEAKPGKRQSTLRRNRLGKNNIFSQSYKGTHLPQGVLPPTTVKKCAQSDNPPLWICDRLCYDITNIPYSPNFTSRERLSFLGHVDKLTQCVGECERIHQTAVPQNYARHALRSLALWLLSLPFALIEDLGLLTGPVMAVTAWLMFGVYQIGAVIEDPFQGSLRLRMLSDAIYRDVMYGADMKNRRESAYALDDELDEWNLIKNVVPGSSQIDPVTMPLNSSIRP